MREQYLLLPDANNLEKLLLMLRGENFRFLRMGEEIITEIEKWPAMHEHLRNMYAERKQISAFEVRIADAGFLQLSRDRIYPYGDSTRFGIGREGSPERKITEELFSLWVDARERN